MATFSATVGSQPVACGQTYTDLGATQSALTLRDFRYFVHDFRLVDDEGNEVPLRMFDGDKWQIYERNAAQGVALIDFEDGSNGCDGGNSDTNAQVRLWPAPAGTYSALRFKLGVPFALNHQDAAVARAPLNLTSMFWSWNGGYKFARIDGSTEGLEGWRFHFGSTGCEGDAQGLVERCAQPNRAEVEVTGLAFEATADNAELPVINFDLAALLANTDLDNFTPETPQGCMGSATDPDCEPYFINLGIPWQGEEPTAQTVFATSPNL